MFYFLYSISIVVSIIKPQVAHDAFIIGSLILTVATDILLLTIWLKKRRKRSSDIQGE